MTCSAWRAGRTITSAWKTARSFAACLRLGDEWVTKVDVGGPSEQPDGGDRLKAAFSDVLKPPR